MSRAIQIIRQRTAYVRAMNILVSDGKRIYAVTHFEEDPDYFTLHRERVRHGRTAFCSAPLGVNWEPVPNHTALVA